MACPPPVPRPNPPNPFLSPPTFAADVNFGAVVKQKDELVAQLRQAKYADVADAYGFEVRPGEARSADPRPPYRRMT